MRKRGPAPKPTKLKLLAGNPGCRKLNEREPEFEAEVPPMPDALDAEARAEWERVAHRLALAGVLTQVDRAVLAAYCVAWSRWLEAERAVAKVGPIIKTKNGNPIHNPYLSVANKALQQMQSLAGEFGMTPSARTRVEATKRTIEREASHDNAKYFKRRRTPDRAS